MYEMFHKAEVLKNDHNFFRPVSQLKTSVIVWYLLNPEPPSQSVGHLTPSQAKSIWGLTEEEIETHYLSTERGGYTEDRFPFHCFVPNAWLVILVFSFSINTIYTVYTIINSENKVL